MIEIHITEALNTLNSSIGKLGTYQAEQAITRALNRAAASGRTEAARQIREKYNRKHGDILKDIGITYASANNQTAYIKPSSLRIKISTLQYNDSGGIYLQLLKSKQSFIRDAFTATMKSGHVGVFARGYYKSRNYKDFIKTAKRMPIAELTTISTFKQLMDTTSLQKVNEKAQETFFKRFEHEANRLLNK